MAKAVKAIPEGYHTVTANLCVRGADRALEFYQKALGAQGLRSPARLEGKILHAEVKIGDSIVFISGEFPEMGVCRAPETLKGTTTGLFLYVPNVDAAFDRTVKAGAKAIMPAADMFWGDRFSQVQDPFGHVWSLATHMEDLTPEEMSKRQQAFFASAKAAD